MALTLTKTQGEVVLCCFGSNLRSKKIVKQHLQAQKLDGGEDGGDLDAGVQTHPSHIGWAGKAWGTCNGRILFIYFQPTNVFAYYNANVCRQIGLVITL